MVQLFMVMPNLEISSCDDCPTERKIKFKKDKYKKNLEFYEQLRSEILNGKEPAWWWSKGNDHNNMMMFDEYTNRNNNNADDIENNVTELPIYSIRIEPEDYSKKLTNNEIPSSYFDEKILIPTLKVLEHQEESKTPTELNKWITLKYTQLITDVSLIEYKYFKTYSEMNQTIKHYFSSDSEELSEELQEEGFNKVNLKLEFFKKLEVLLVRLKFLKNEFENRYGKLFASDHRSLNKRLIRTDTNGDGNGKQLRVGTSNYEKERVEE